MKLTFPLPHLMEIEAMLQPWERAVTGPDQLRMARRAEELGYDMIALPEHLAIPPDDRHTGSFWLHSTTAQAALAGATQRIRLNSCVTILPLQHPILHAKALATADWLSGGRMVVTFGLGSIRKEYDYFGVPWEERGAIADEYLEAIIALWTQDRPSFEGRYVRFRDIGFDPKPVQKPHLPIWFGGDADAVLSRVARYGTGWWPFLSKPEDIPAKIDFIKSRPDYAGKLDDVFYGMSTGRVGEGHVVLDDPNARPSHNKQWIIDRLGELADLGVTMSSVTTPDVDDLQAFYDYTQWVAEEIMPAVR